MTSKINLPYPKFYSRSVTLDKNQQYGVGRTTLVKKWKIITPNIKAKIIINGIPLNIDFLDGIEFDIPKIREYLKNIIPLTYEENELCILESTIYGSILNCMDHYKYFPINQLENYLFTGDLCIKFEPFDDTINFPDKIDIIEEHILSLLQLTQRLKTETLEDIDKNCTD